jgi:hypothetical protein
LAGLSAVERPIFLEKAGGQNLTSEFGQQAALTVFLRPASLDTLVSKLTEITAGQISATRGDFTYI